MVNEELVVWSNVFAPTRKSAEDHMVKPRCCTLTKGVVEVVELIWYLRPTWAVLEAGLMIVDVPVAANIPTAVVAVYPPYTFWPDRISPLKNGVDAL